MQVVDYYDKGQALHTAYFGRIIQRGYYKNWVVVHHKDGKTLRIRPEQIRRIK